MDNILITTQRFINAFLLNSVQRGKPKFLKLDGVHGALTREAARWVTGRLETKTKSEGLVWDKNFMFIGLRTDLDLDNSFDDWFVIIRPNTFLACPASTVSGVPGIAKYANLWIRGRQGVGTIAENQQIDYLVVRPNSQNAWSMWTGGLGFLFQDKPIRLYRGAVRGANGVWLINRQKPVEGDLGGGFNVHSWAGWWSSAVQNLSEGCQVTPAIYWANIFPILSERSRVTYTLLQYF